VIPEPAQYLLRFDDLCPTIARARWERFRLLIKEFDLRPILAVIPDNLDHELRLSPPDPEFWAQMRELEAAGSTIALHGFHHRCESKGESLLPLHRSSEFAGVPEETQRDWIRRGLNILREKGLSPKMWVAPRHGFDRTTLRVLRREGISLLSDGFARQPFLREGFTWIPQQLWGPVEKSAGLWTICIHSNSSHPSQEDRLREFLGQHAAQFISVDRAVAKFTPATLSLSERLYGAWQLWRYRRRNRKRRAYRSPRGQAE
jgi:hypothetical protein